MILVFGELVFAVAVVLIVVTLPVSRGGPGEGADLIDHATRRTELRLECGGLLRLNGPYEGAIDAAESGTWLTLAAGEFWGDVDAGRDADGDGISDFVVGFYAQDDGRGVALLESGADWAAR